MLIHILLLRPSRILHKLSCLLSLPGSGGRHQGPRLPDCNNNAVVGKVGCHIVAWPSNAVVPLRHQQMPCTSVQSWRALKWPTVIPRLPHAHSGHMCLVAVVLRAWLSGESLSHWIKGESQHRSACCRARQRSEQSCEVPLSSSTSTDTWADAGQVEDSFIVSFARSAPCRAEVKLVYLRARPIFHGPGSPI